MNIEITVYKCSVQSRERAQFIHNALSWIAAPRKVSFAILHVMQVGIILMQLKSRPERRDARRNVKVRS